MTKLRVVDLFCGAGGFSEGFRQAGFQILAGVDNWQVATSTFKANHPASFAILDDVVIHRNLSNIQIFQDDYLVNTFHFV